MLSPHIYVRREYCFALLNLEKRQLFNRTYRVYIWTNFVLSYTLQKKRFFFSAFDISVNCAVPHITSSSQWFVSAQKALYCCFVCTYRLVGTCTSALVAKVGSSLTAISLSNILRPSYASERSVIDCLYARRRPLMSLWTHSCRRWWDFCRRLWEVDSCRCKKNDGNKTTNRCLSLFCPCHITHSPIETAPRFWCLKRFKVHLEKKLRARAVSETPFVRGHKESRLSLCACRVQAMTQTNRKRSRVPDGELDIVPPPSSGRIAFLRHKKKRYTWHY